MVNFAYCAAFVAGILPSSASYDPVVDSETASLLQVKLDRDSIECKSGKCKTTTPAVLKTSTTTTAPMRTTTTSIFAYNENSVVGVCELSGDPHIKTFDRDEKDVHFYNYGDYWIVKSNLVWIQARYWSTRPDARSAIRGFAFSEPKVGGRTMVIFADALGGCEVDGETMDPGHAFTTEYMTHSLGGRVGDEHAGMRHVFNIPKIHTTVTLDRYSSHMNAIVETPQTAGQMGHCGNFNDDPDDDMSLSQEMVEPQFLLFPHQAWGDTVPPDVECKDRQGAVNHCVNKWNALGDHDQADIDACVIDYCSAGAEVADSGWDTDKETHHKKQHRRRGRGWKDDDDGDDKKHKDDDDGDDKKKHKDDDDGDDKKHKDDSDGGDKKHKDDSDGGDKKHKDDSDGGDKKHKDD